MSAFTDIAITWNPLLGRGDWSMTNGDLSTGSPLETAVLVSLFTDQIAAPDFVLTDGTTDRRGWWADAFETSPIGSRFWQLDRAKKANAQTLLLEARDIGQQALQWLLDDGVAATVDVAAWWYTPSSLGIRVKITEPDGTTSNFSYAGAWQGVF